MSLCKTLFIITVSKQENPRKELTAWGIVLEKIIIAQLV
jgi:hypothetical protein